MDYSKLNNIAASMQDVENAASIIENRLNTKIDEDIQSLQDTISDIGNNPSSEQIDDNIISAALNDLSDKVDDLNDKVDNNELVTASALADLDEKCIQKDKDGNIIILKKGEFNIDNPEHINKKIKIRFINDIDLVASQYIKMLKAIYKEDITPESENTFKQELYNQQENYKLFIIDNDQYQNLIISEIYDSNNNLIDENSITEIPGLAVLSKESPIVANTDYYVNDFYIVNETFINIFNLKKSGELYLFGLGNYPKESDSDENSNEESKNPKSVQEVISNLKNDLLGLQNLNLDFKDNLKIDSQGNLVVHEIGTYETETTTDSGFYLSNDYYRIHRALTYDPNSSTTILLEGYTQESLRQLLIQLNLINPDYYYYVVLEEDGGYGYLTDSEFFSPDNHQLNFLRFTSIEINETDVEFSDYIEKLNNDDTLAYIVIGLETELSNEDLSNVTMTYKYNPEFDKYIAKINLYNGNLYLPGIGNYTVKNPYYNVSSVQEILNSSSITTADVIDIAIDKSGLHYDSNSNFISYIPNGTGTAYTTNTITSITDSILIGRLNTATNIGGAVLIGKSNTLNQGNNSIIIGAENYNNKDYNVSIGIQNYNTSLYGINIGYYNHNASVINDNISIGRDNQIYKDIDGIVIGSYNSIARFTSVQNGQKTIAIGKGLFTDNDNITLGFYNAYYNNGSVMPKFAVANGTSNNRSNILEQYDNGDLFIKGLGGFTGANSQYNRNTSSKCKTLQQIITDLTNRITTLEAQISGGGNS